MGKRIFEYKGSKYQIDDSEVDAFLKDMPAATEVKQVADNKGNVVHNENGNVPGMPVDQKKKEPSSNPSPYSSIPGMDQFLSGSKPNGGTSQSSSVDLKYAAFGSSNIDFPQPTKNIRIPESVIPNTISEKIDRKEAIGKAKNLVEFDIIDQQQREKLTGGDYLQSRTGKVTNFINRIRSGKPIDQKDWEYLKNAAPGVVNDLIDQVTGALQVVDDKNPLPALTKFYGEKYSTDKAYSIAQNSKNAIHQAVQLGFDINQYDNQDYLNKVQAELKNSKEKEINSSKEELHPEQSSQWIGGAFVGPKDAMYKAALFMNKENEIGQKYSDLASTYATASTQLKALKETKLTPEQLGEFYLKIADRDKYDLYKRGGSKDKKVKGELNKIGYQFIRGTLDKGRIAEIDALDEKFNDNFPEQKKEEIYHRIGAELYKSGGHPGDIKLYDKIADTQFSKEDRDFYYKHVRPEEEAKFIGTNVPLSGFANKLAHGIMTSSNEQFKTALGWIGLRSTEDRANDALKGEDVKYQTVGEYGPGAQRLKELKAKKNLSFDEISEMKDLERFVGVRSGASEILDNMGNVTGQVVQMALGTKGIGAVGKATLGGTKLLNTASKLETLDKLGAAALGYAQSYDAAQRDYLQLKPNASKGELMAYGNWIGFLNAASENIFQDKKVFEAFQKEAAPLAARAFASLTDKNVERLTKKELGNLYTIMLNDVKNFAKGYGKSSFQEVAEEEIVQLGTSIADGIAAPDKFNLNDEWSKVKATAYDMAVGGALVAIPGAIHDVRSSRLSVPLLNQLGYDSDLRDEVTNVINHQVSSGKINQNEANKKISILNTLASIHGTTIPQAFDIRPLRKEEVEKITALTLQERLNHEKIKDGSDFSEELKTQNKEIADLRNKIIRKEVVVNDDYTVTDVEEWNRANQPSEQPTKQEQIDFENKKQLESDQELINNINNRDAKFKNPNSEGTTDSGSNTQESVPENSKTIPETPQQDNSINGVGSNKDQSGVSTTNRDNTQSKIDELQERKKSDLDKINNSKMGSPAKKAAIKRIEEKYQKLIDKEISKSEEINSTKPVEDVIDKQQPTTSNQSETSKVEAGRGGVESKTTDQVYSDNAKKAFIEGKINAFTMDENGLYLNTNGVRVVNGFKDNGNMDVFEASKVELTKDEKRELKQIEADREFGDEGTGERKKDLAKKIFQRSLSEQSLKEQQPTTSNESESKNDAEKIKVELTASNLNNGLSNFKLEEAETTGVIEPTSPLKIFNIKKDGNIIGYISLKIDKDGNWGINYVDIKKSERRKGYAESLYRDLNESLNKNNQGVLYSDKTLLESEEDSSVSPPKKIWEKLINEGVAEKTNDGRYRFKPKSLEQQPTTSNQSKISKETEISNKNQPVKKIDNEKQTEINTEVAKTIEITEREKPSQKVDGRKTFKEKRELVNNRSNVIKKAKELDFIGDIRKYTMQQLMGMSISPNIIDQVLGRKSNSNWKDDKKITGEKRARLNWTRNRKNQTRYETVSDIAHEIWERAKSEWRNENIDDAEIEDIVVDTIQSYGSTGDIASYLVDTVLQGNINNKQNDYVYQEIPEGIEDFWDFDKDEWISPLHEKAWNDVLESIDLMSDEEINSYFTEKELADYDQYNNSTKTSDNEKTNEAQQTKGQQKTEVLDTQDEITAASLSNEVANISPEKQKEVYTITTGGEVIKANVISDNGKTVSVEIDGKQTIRTKSEIFPDEQAAYNYLSKMSTPVDEFKKQVEQIDITKVYDSSELSKLETGDYILVKTDDPTVFKQGIVRSLDTRKVLYDSAVDNNILEYNTGKENILRFYKKKSSKKPKIETKKQEPAPIENKSKEDKLWDDIDDLANQLWNPGGTLSSGGLDPKKIEIGVKLIGKFTELGIYKFQDIAKHIYEKFGDTMAEFIHELKAIYGAYYNTTTDDIADKMDSNIRSITFEQIKNSKPLNNNQNESSTSQLLSGENRGESQAELPSNLSGTNDQTSIEQSNSGQSTSISEKTKRKPKPGTGQGDLFSGDDAILEEINLKQEHKPKVTFEAEDNSTGLFNVARKFNDNLKALQVLSTLIEYNRQATNEEKTILSKYVGYGGLKEIAFDPNNDTNWEGSRSKYRDVVRETVEVLSKIDSIMGRNDSLNNIKGGILNAHYTSKSVIEGIYDGLRHLGFDGGRILEPSAGIGNFITYMPNTIHLNSGITAIELDNITGNILKKIHDDAEVKITGFEKASIPNNSYDLVVSNIPFGNYSVFDQNFKGEKSGLLNKIHKYFFAKAIDSARDGGLIALVTSTGVLDTKFNDDIRKYIRDNSIFLGAIRLPSNSFKNNAGTEVVTDVIFLKKDTSENKLQTQNFIELQTEKFPNKEGDLLPVTINKYFIDNPENILGQIVSGEGLYDKDGYSVKDNGKANNIGVTLTNILPLGIYDKDGEIGLNYKKTLNEDIKEGNLHILNGIVVVKTSGIAEPVKLPNYISNVDVERYIKLRDSLMDVIYSEFGGLDDRQLELKRQNLNNVYDEIQRVYNTKSKSKVLSKLMNLDSDGYSVMALTNPDGTKADILKKRTIQPVLSKNYAENIEDAILISLSEKAKIDIDRISELRQIPVSQVLIEAKGKIFELPSGGFVIREEYLSGNVKKKLAEAIDAVGKGFQEFSNNVTELTKIIPEDIPYFDIEVRLGSRWVPTAVFEQFARELFATPNISITYSKNLDTYDVSDSTSIESREKYGTPRRNGTKIFNDALHQNTPKIIIKDRDGNVLKEASEDATREAMVKYELIREEFGSWIYRDEERRTLLQKIYNEKFNTTIKRVYNGKHLTLPGIYKVELKPHQKDAVWRLVVNNGGIIDHIVGAGKTYVIVAACMEMRRTGVAKKPMVIALKSTIPQIVESFKSAYPLAKILSPKENDFNAKNRQKLLAQIANNEWDAVILTHENYGKILQSPEFKKEQIDEELDELRSEDSSGYSKRQAGGLEIRIKNLESRLDKLSSLKKDNVLTFQQMGIDHILVDESQQFKNLSYVTRIQNVAGLSKPEGSMRSFNLLTGIRSLQKKLGGDKGVTFLSGTPISNSMVEMYLLLKYIRPNKLNELAMNTFDSWANTFASATSEIEFAVTGQFKTKTRFREFINVPELSMLYTEIADVRTDDNLVLDKPKMKDGKYIPVICNMDEDQKQFAKRIIDFAKTKDGSHVGINLPDDKKSATMLIATNLASKMAIDMRLINKNYGHNPEGKIEKVSDNIAKIYNETSDFKGVQLVFSDLGTPKEKGDLVGNIKDYMEDELSIPLDTLNEIFGDENEEGYRKKTIQEVTESLSSVLELTQSEIDDIIDKAKESAGSFNVYQAIKDRLIEKGIPSEQVVFIHSYKTAIQKNNLFEEVKKGNIRIILGSTQKLGTGVNVQDRVSAIHHVDVPWRPSDMEQRNGRGLRQGNWAAKKFLNNELPVYAYATELTLDAMKYQILQVKQRFLNQVKSGAIDDRVIKEESGDDIGLAEMIAATSGNPDILTKNKLDALKDKLQRQKKSFDNNYYEAQSKKRNLESLITHYQERIPNIEKDIEELTNKMVVDDENKMVINTINGDKIEFNEEGKPATRIDYAKRGVEIINNKIGSLTYNKVVKMFDFNGNIIIAGELAAIKNITGQVESYSEKIHFITPSGEVYNLGKSKVPGVILNNIQDVIVYVIPREKKDIERKIKEAEQKIAYYDDLIKNDVFPKKQELEDVTKQLREVEERLQKWNNDEEQQTSSETGSSNLKVDNYSFPKHNSDVFMSLVKGVNLSNNESVFIAKINRDLNYQEEYTKLVKPLIQKYNGTWNGSIKGIVFNDQQSAINFKNEIENEFGENSSEIQFMAGKYDPLEFARNEYELAKKAFDKKRSELYRSAMNDQADLFGVRKSASNNLFGDQMESVKIENIETALAPYKKRVESAKKALEQANKDSQSQGTLFNTVVNDKQTINSNSFNELVFRISKAFPGIRITTDESLVEPYLKSKNVDYEIWGAKLPSGEIYISPNVMNAETPIHEASHLWEALFPDKWKEGIRLFKNTEGFKKALIEIQQNPFYSNLSEEQQSSEALNTLIGRKGEGYYKKGIYLSKFIAWLNKTFNAIAEKFGIKKITPDDKLNEFVNNVIGDILSGKELKRLIDTKVISVKDTYDEAREIAHGVKKNDLDAINEMAKGMSEKIPSGSIVIPMTSRTGKATNMLEVAKAIRKYKKVIVKDILSGSPRESLYKMKIDGIDISKIDLGITASEHPTGNVFVLDNVMATGKTAESILNALPNAKILVYGIDKNSIYRSNSNKAQTNFQIRQKTGPVTKDELFDAKNKFYEALNKYIADNDTETDFIDAFDTVANVNKKEAEKLIAETPNDIRETLREILSETPEPPKMEKQEPLTPETTTEEMEDMVSELLNAGLQFHDGTEIMQDSKVTIENRGFDTLGGTRQKFALEQTNKMIENILRKYRSIMGGDFNSYLDKILGDNLIPAWIRGGILTRLQAAEMDGMPIIPKAQVEYFVAKYSFGEEGTNTEIQAAMQLLQKRFGVSEEDNQRLMEIFGKSGKLIQLTRQQLDELVAAGKVDEITSNQLAEMEQQIESSSKTFEQMEAERKQLLDKIDKLEKTKKAKAKRNSIKLASPELITNIQKFIDQINEIKC